MCVWRGGGEFILKQQGSTLKGSPGVRDSHITMPDSLFLLVGSPADSLNETKFFVLSFSVDSKCH